jgi:6-pyruvoyltetrahydropterin/6-carboxytetrahydropterin synthase
MITQIHKDVWFRAAHYLRDGYKGKCRRLHGEFYRVEVWIRGFNLDKYGLLVDFGDIKRLIHEKYDHRCLNDIPPFKKELNPTAENICAVIYKDLQKFCDKQENRPEVSKVRVYESTNDYAEHFSEDDGVYSA